MARKEKIQIRRDEDLTEIDLELDDALAKLESSNERVVELLKTIEGEGAQGAETPGPAREGEPADGASDAQESQGKAQAEARADAE